MQSECHSPPSTADDLAREYVYRFLSAVLGGPYSDGWGHALDAGNQSLALEAADCLGSETETTDMARLVEELHAPLDALRAEYDRVFGLLVPKECPPYETEYYPTQETFGRSQQMADVAGFYRAFGIEPAHASPERPDHLALQLEFMAFLLMKERFARAAVDLDPESGEQASVCDRAQRDFFRDHLAWWVPAFAAGLRRKAGGGYQDALARVLSAWVWAECRRLDISAVLRPVRPDLIEKAEEQSGCAACPLHL
jgi:DMSO reductase family type II enzyme chaperone